MIAYRKHVEPLVGGAYPITNQAELAEAKEHYGTFASGPMQAFVHHVKSYNKRLPEEEREKLMGGLLQRFSASTADYTGKDPAKVLRDLEDLETPLNPEEYSFGKQLDAVRNYLTLSATQGAGRDNAWEKENLSPLLDRMRAGVTGAARGYGGLRAPLNALHKIPKTVGMTLLGAGAAGLTGWGGYKLYQLLTKNRREEEIKRREAAEKSKLTNSLFAGLKAPLRA